MAFQRMLCGLVACLWLSPAPVLAQVDAPVPVYVEDSPAAADLAEEARALQAAGRPVDAANTWQRVVDEHDGKLVPAGDGLYHDVGRWVWEEIAADETMLAVYRQVDGPEAERARSRAVPAHRHEAELQRLLMRYRLMPAALEAGLDLAALALERAEAEEAAHLLDQLADHPDVDAHAGRYRTLRAIAASLLGQTGRVAAEREQLAMNTDAATLRRFDRALESIEETRLDGEADLPQIEGLLAEAQTTPLWTLDVSRARPLTGPAAYQQRQVAPGILPVAGGGRVYLNNNSELLAVDRYSGHQVWSIGGETQTRDRRNDAAVLMPHLVQQAVDRRGVALADGLVVAVLGRISTSPVQLARNDRRTELLALDAATGEIRWRLGATAADIDLDRAYFQGTPVVHNGRVYAFLGRQQASGFQDTLVLAADLETGVVLWRRHVSSVVTASRLSSGPTPQMSVTHDTVFVSDGLATIAAIDGRQGRTHWTRILLQPSGARARGIGSSLSEFGVEPGPPILLEAGLLVAVPGGQTSPALLDPDTGARLQELSGDLADTYLLPYGQDVVAVGSVVSYLEGATLERRWRVRLDAARTPSARPAVAEGVLVVPARERAHFISLADGAMAGSVPADRLSNAMVVDGQIVLASANEVRSYMPFEQARQALLDAARRQPEDPRPGVSLAQLALPRGEDQAVLAGVDMALEALARAPMGEEATQARQALVFDRVLALATQSDAGTPALREALLERLASISTGPKQEVGYHLGRGALLEETAQFAEAIEHYQTVLMDGRLGSQLFRQEDTLRQAGLEARRRMEAIIREHGRGVYQAFETMAAHELERLALNPAARPGQFLELAGRYPLASAASRAVLEAGRAHAEQGEVPEAATLFRRALRQAEDAELLATVAGELAALYQENGRPREAAAFLRRFEREHPEVQPRRQGQAVAVATWLEELASSEAASQARPQIRLPLAAPALVHGELLIPQGEAATDLRGDVFVVRRNDRVALHRLPSGRQVWEAPLPARDATLLSLDARQAIFWSNETRTLTALTIETGAKAWADVDARAVLEVAREMAVEAQPPNEAHQQFMQQIDVKAPLEIRDGRVVIVRPEPDESVLVTATDAVIALADRQGGVIGIDRNTGQVLWQQVLDLEQVAHLEAGTDAMILTGVRGLGTDAQSGGIAVLDLLTGELTLPVIEEDDPAQWVGFTTGRDGDLIVSATTNLVTGRRLRDGAVAWRITLPGPPLTGRGWASRELLLLEANQSSLVVIESATGEIASRLNIHPIVGSRTLAIEQVDEQWHLLAGNGALALESRGGELWRDALARPEQQLLQQVVGDQYIFLLAGDAPTREGVQAHILVPPGGNDERIVIRRQAEAAAPDRHRLYLLDRISGLLVEEYELDLPASASAPGRGVLLANHLLFTAGDRTLLIPGRRGELGD